MRMEKSGLETTSENRCGKRKLGPTETWLTQHNRSVEMRGLDCMDQEELPCLCSNGWIW